MSQTQQKYSAYDRELLAVYESVKYFKEILQGQEAIIKTDHKPLIYAFKQRSDKAALRQARQLDLIAQFSTNIKHISGTDNIVADTLSRADAIELLVIVSTQELAQE